MPVSGRPRQYPTELSEAVPSAAAAQPAADGPVAAAAPELSESELQPSMQPSSLL